MQHMLMSGGIGVVYQPIVDLASGRICGWEALARYAPDPTTYSPLDLVEAARDHELLNELTWRVVSHAHATLCAVSRIVDVPLIVSVNVELEQLRRDNPLFDKIAELPWPENTRLILEITERGQDLWHDDYAEAARSLNDHDIMLALDDFGAGAARLTFLHHPQWALVKFDRQLIASDGRTEQIVMTHTARMFADLGVLSLAEGIETHEQLASVKALGIELGQGYLLGRPASAELLLADLASRGLDVLSA
ncbi:EAL domain-containing protein [Nocardioides sp. Kera G14]|uniref:EAL domain-containing protein n=1 Tax=Nocardioides sp. Kera G14 TaxID=2884264 RepID=UPI001D127CFB|nr:EAL domain-containing protein [Nocardioides sp. Kera G14]UDY22976.1 EAL domain-containing protein [Nocardioides sp. Kera G14]